MKLLTYADLHPAYVIVNGGHRPLLLDSIHQYRTYGGLLLGLPSEDRIRKHVDSARRRAVERLGDRVPLHLVAPGLVPFTERQQNQRIEPRSRGLVPEGEPFQTSGKRLPLVTCIATFYCPEPLAPQDDIAGSMYTYSILGLLWFQERLAPPIDQAVLRELQTLDWTALAADVSD